MSGNYNNQSQYKSFSSPTGFMTTPPHQGFMTPSPPQGYMNNSNPRYPKPAFASPPFNSPNYRSPSQFQYHPYQSTPNRFNTAGSPSQWTRRNNRSFGSYSSPGSDGSFSSPFNNSSRNRGKYSRSPRNDSNPGHCEDIRQYAHPSMLEDPWKDLMDKLEQNDKSS